MTDRIRASKPLEDKPGYLVACDLTDPKATQFEVRYANNYQVTLHFDTKYMAEQVASALDNEFMAGKKQQLAELRNYLGIK